KRSFENSHRLAGDQTPTEECQIGLVRILDQRFNDALRDGDRTIVTGKKRRNADSALNRQPAVTFWIENEKDISREKRRPNSPELAGMTDGLLDRRQMRSEALRFEVHFRLALALGLRVDEKPPLVPLKRQSSWSGGIRHPSPIRPGFDQASEV